MMKDMKILLAELDSILREKNPENYKKLQDPLPEKEVSERMKALGVEDQAFKDLFLWKNGVDISGGIDATDELFVFGVLFSMEGVAEYAEFDPGSPFIPLIGDVTGDMLLFNNSRDGDRGKLHIYSVSLLSIDEPYTYFDSINTMAETTIRAYKEGALSIDRRDGRLAVDTDRHRKIAAKMNPGSAFWKLK